MSKIEKLSIQGVRSFGPQNREAIQFNTPLTLIVGYNGSGKTTIIECLKYATTGDLPPNSKGGAFIHDPKLCGEKEVLAQVKLAFKGTGGARHVVTRNLQLTVKKTARSLKTLEGSLVVNNNGERTTVSTRVADLDEQVPLLLGVSRAVLDAVIFCHQDESLWPMSEPSALKKRFDEIFEALRYTKAIENLKVLRKKQGEELAKLKIFEEQDKINKEKGEKAEKRSMGLQEEIETARKKCEQITREMSDLQDQIKDKHMQANTYLSIVQELNNMRDKLEYREEAVAEIKKTLVELPEDDESLETQLAQHEERIVGYRVQAEENKVQYNQLQKDLATSRKDLAAKLSQQGKHQSDKEKHERQLEARRELINEAASEHGFRGYDGELSDSQVDSFKDRIRKLLAEKKRDLERVKKENEAEVDEASAAITEVARQRDTRIQERSFAKQQMTGIDKTTAGLQRELSKLDVDEGSKVLLQNRIEDIESRRAQALRDLETAQFDTQLQQENDRLRQLETENETLGRELVECTRRASDRAQLDYRKKEMLDRKRKLDALKNTWNGKFVNVIGGDWLPDTLEPQFQDILKRQNGAVADVRRKRDQAREKQQSLDLKLKMARQACQKKAAEAARCKKAVLDVMAEMENSASIESYPERLSDLEKQVDECKEEVSLFTELARFYESAQNSLEKKNKCSMCDRHFEPSQEVSRTKLVAKITRYLNPADRKACENELEAKRADLEALKAVKGQFDSHQRVAAELPGLREEIGSIESEHALHERQLESLDADLAAEEEKLLDIEGMNKTVMLISQTVKDIKDSEAQIERIQSQQMSGVATRSADEIHELQATNTEQQKGVKTKVAKLSSDRQRLKDQLSGFDLEKSELTNKIDNADRQLERKRDLERQIQDLKDQHVQKREIIQKADQELEAIEPRLAEVKSVRDDVLQRGRSREQAVAEQRDKVAAWINKLQVMEHDIQAYVEGGGSSNLAANQRAIGNLEKIIAATEKEITDLTANTNKIKQDIDNGDRKQKNINDNLTYRKSLRMIDDLREKIVGLSSRHADEDYELHIREARGLETTYNRLLADRGSMMGQMKTKDEELERLLTEWEQDYKNAARKYRESHIKVETTKAAIEDLGRYGSALDKAIMQYHGLKMEEVNRIAGELWQSTYQGTDIDTILIRSDAETATGKRNYNYRVCMVKQDTEMDMRGRCSAGQKVLASIIIRLALAESFGVNCGLIALDEPTTNLDRDNIKSLAESLHAIIRARQQQSNFQLIVITHDEEFLRHMRCSDFCDSFFWVRRDDRQNSVITRESITKVI